MGNRQKECFHLVYTSLNFVMQSVYIPSIVAILCSASIRMPILAMRLNRARGRNFTLVRQNITDKKPLAGFSLNVFEHTSQEIVCLNSCRLNSLPVKAATSTLTCNYFKSLSTAELHMCAVHNILA